MVIVRSGGRLECVPWPTSPCTTTRVARSPARRCRSPTKRATTSPIDVIKYLEVPPTADELRAIIAKLDDPPARLVRRERWDELDIVADDLATTDGIVAILTEHPELMERPLIVTADRAFIGRPTERVSELFDGLAR